MIIADLVLKNGKIATIDSDFSFHQAVAVKDGIITYVGTNEDIDQRTGPQTQVVDLEGKVLLPGANDAHMHATLTGLHLGENFVDVGGAAGIQTMEDLQNIIAQAVEKAQPGQWIYGSGFLEFLIKECAQEERGIQRWDLDPVSPNNPVMLTDFGLHTLVINSKAMEIAGISEHHPDLPAEQGLIEKDPATGKVNGRLFEWSAHQLVGDHAQQLTDEELKDCILRTQDSLRKLGVTSHSDCVGPGIGFAFMGAAGTRAIHAYQQLCSEDKLTARVSLSLHPPKKGVHTVKEITAGLDQLDLPAFTHPDKLQMRTIKLFGDQGLWMRATDENPECSGRSVFPGDDAQQAKELTDSIVELHRQGWQVSVHALGGKTIDTCVDAYCQAQEQYPRVAPRHFLIHGDDMTVENAKVMGKYGIGVSPQPIACNIVGAMRAATMTAGNQVFDWQRYKDEGVWVAGGSDSPCFSSNWLEGVQFAVTRTTMDGTEIRPDLAMNLPDAIRMYTIDGAIQDHMEASRGSIEIGKVADFQLLDTDIFQCAPESIGTIRVDMTIFDGKIVYQRED